MAKVKKNVDPEVLAVPPAPPTEQEYFEQTVYMLRRQYERALESVASFSKKFSEYPAEALWWSSSAFEAAAVIEIVGSILRSIDAPASKITLRSLHDYALDQTLRFIDRGSSTSPVCNYMDKCRGVAWARVFEMVKGLVK